MFAQNPRRTYAFVCPGCLTTFHLYIWEIEDGVPTCNYCGFRWKGLKIGGEL